MAEVNSYTISAANSGISGITINSAIYNTYSERDAIIDYIKEKVKEEFDRRLQIIQVKE